MCTMVRRALSGAAGRKRAGFTLIELLVVIAIIAILAAILFPVFARARENARKSQCLSNMKQVLLGLRQYLQDYDERGINWWYNAPGYTGPRGENGWYWWVDALQPYIKNNEIFFCPSRKGESPNRAPVTNGKWVSQYYLWDQPLRGSGTEADPYWRGFDVTMIEAQVVFPAEFVWLHEGWEVFATPSSLHTAPVVVHMDGLNLGFFDGHTKWLHRISGYGTGKTQRPNGQWVWTYWISDR